MQNILMKKLLISGLLLFSTGFAYASALTAEQYIQRHLPSYKKNHLLNYSHRAEFNAGKKAIFMARMDAIYDMGLLAYLQTYFSNTPQAAVLADINQTKYQLAARLAVLEHNTWDDWKWAGIKYSTVVLATIICIYIAQNYGKLPHKTIA